MCLKLQAARAVLFASSNNSQEDHLILCAYVKHTTLMPTAHYLLLWTGH